MTLLASRDHHRCAEPFDRPGLHIYNHYLRENADLMTERRMTMDKHLSPETMTLYRATAKQRWKEKERERLARHKRAWRIARQASELLKKQYGADRVEAFGSLVHGDWFSETSDVDLAVWGLQSEDYFVAVAKLQDLSPEFQVDLVAVEYCKPELREVIMDEGEPL